MQREREEDFYEQTGMGRSTMSCGQMAKNQQITTRSSRRTQQHSFTIRKDSSIFEAARQYVKGNESGSSVMIPHVCNNVNAFGAGFASAVAKEYYEVKANFHLLGRSSKMGQVQYVTVHTDPKYQYKIIFANMIAQNGIYHQERNLRPLNYAALTHCMMDVKMTMKKMMYNEDQTKFKILAPKFGSGLAGGNWDFISDLIDDCWSEFGVEVFLQKKN